MNHHGQDHATTDDDLFAADTGAPAGNEEGGALASLMTVHRLLRGRYPLVIIVSLLLGPLFAAVTYKSIMPTFTSVGMIRITPKTGAVIYRDVEDPISMFDAYLGYQVNLLTSQRVINLAMRSEAWKNFGTDAADISLSDFINQLDVTNPKRSQIISVAFTDENPRLSQVAVKALIDAYLSVQGESNAQSGNKTLAILENRRTKLNSELRALRQQILAVANEYGTDDLDQLYDLKLKELIRFEAMLADTRRLLDMNELPDRAGADEKNQVGGVYWTAEEVARADPATASLLQERDAKQRALTELTARFGENHRQVKSARESLAVTNQFIENRVEQINDGSLDVGGGGTQASAAPGGANVAQLQSSARALQKMVDETRQATLALGRDKLRIDEIRTQMAESEKYLNETELRVEQLNVESARESRVTVASEGDIPLAPTNSKKRLQFSAMMGFGGVVLGLGCVLVYGLLNRRLRSFDDAKSTLGRDSFLGLLPRLPEDLSDPQQALVASLSVHEIRAMLQRRDTGDRAHVLGITSATAGAGKTSLTLAIGLSFAATGAKTLVIDFDVVGAGLSSRINKIVRRRVGQAMVEAQLISDQQLAEVIRVADRTSRRVDEAVVDMGLVTLDQLTESGILAGSGYRGIVDVLAGDPLQDCVSDTGIDNLSVVSVGNAQISDIGTLSKRAVRDLIASARQQYDIVIFDTGPILGSLEAAIACIEVDDVVLVLAQGEYQRYAEQSAKRLTEIGARVAGLVFNKANLRDIERFSSTSSLSSRMSQPDTPDAIINLRAAGDCPTEYGPIAHATAACLPETENSSHRAAS